MRSDSRRVPFVFLAGSMIGLVVLACSSCRTRSSPEPTRSVPSAELARQAVENALRSWQDDPRSERTTTTIRPIMFVEQQQPPDQRLVRFEMMGETPGYENEGYRRFLVRLSLDDPADSVVATYYVFGQDPVWVYRAEDFEMIMHMDKSMMPPPPPPPSPPPGGEGGTSALPARASGDCYSLRPIFSFAKNFAQQRIDGRDERG